MHSCVILAISGSLRAGSLNSAVLRLAAAVPLTGVQIRVYTGLADLPPFNPDQEGHEEASVLDLQKQLREADGVLIACPEYAHGLPGAFKNALDWVVASGELVNKPVALINLFERSTWAPALLRETLTMMTAKVVEPASITLALPSNKITADQLASDDRIAQALRTSIAALAQAIRQHAANHDDLGKSGGVVE